jgi:hypothetical protein
MVNGTSYIENCETSAVGRALGMIGLGLNGGGICSAEELVNAVTAQQQMKNEEKASFNPPAARGAMVETSRKLPETAQKPVSVNEFIKEEIGKVQAFVGLKTYAEAKAKVLELAQSLVDGGAVPAFDWKKITMDEAKNLFDAIRKTIPDGDPE